LFCIWSLLLDQLGRVAQLKKRFTEKNTKVIALSVDKVDNHGGWIKDINEIVGCTVDFVSHTRMKTGAAAAQLQSSQQLN